MDRLDFKVINWHSAFLVALLFLALVIDGCRRSPAPLEPELARFVEAKRQQTKMLVRLENTAMPKQGWELFDALAANDFHSATKLFEDLRLQSGLYGGTPPPPNILIRVSRALDSFLGRLGFRTPKPSALQGAAWQTLSEAFWAYRISRSWTPEFLNLFSDGVLTNIPTDSIYFGASDPARFTISARLASHVDGRPFFVLTQNQLADTRYLNYVKAMYGKKLNLLSPDDSMQAFNKYLREAQQRLTSSNTKPGEIVQVVGGSVSVAGQRAAFEVNAILTQMIFEKTPTHEFYIEENWPLDWLYPHLTPAGPIFRINRQPLETLSESIIQKDREYWQNVTARLIGNWLHEDTSLKDILEFIEKCYLGHNEQSFPGDRRYLTDPLAWDGFGRWRSAIADLYDWRARHSVTDKESQRMNTEADFAFRQAFAMAPNSIRLTERYAEFLRVNKRQEEALKIVKICANWQREDLFLKTVLEEIRTNAPVLSPITNFFN